MVALLHDTSAQKGLRYEPLGPDEIQQSEIAKDHMYLHQVNSTHCHSYHAHFHNSYQGHC